MTTYKVKSANTSYPLYQKNGGVAGTIPASTIITADNSIYLIEKQKDCWIILTPEIYLNKCVAKTSVEPYNVSPPEPPAEVLPPPDEVTMKWKNAAGVVIVTADYIRKTL